MVDTLRLVPFNRKPENDELLEQYNADNGKVGQDKIGALEYKIRYIMKFTEQVLERFVVGYDTIQLDYLTSLIGEVPDALKIDLGGLDEKRPEDTAEVS
jgi:hypothetical protein